MSQKNIPIYSAQVHCKWVDQAGMSIIEVIIAMALFAIVAAVGLATVAGGFTTNRLGSEHTQATVFAQTGIEAARSIRNQGWESDFIATACGAGCGLSTAGGSWQWSGSNNTLGPFTRTVRVEDVQRDGSGVIVTNGGTDDPDTKRVISTVTWDFSPARNNTVELATYLTYFRQLIPPPVGDWTAPSFAGAYNASGSDDMVKVATQGNYAYLVRNAGNPRFIVADISSPASPALVGSLALASSNPIDVFVSGEYAYLVGTQNNNEFNVINIANPAAPTLVGNFNTTGNADANGVYVVGTTAYVVTSSSGSPEFYIVNISNPAAISLIGSLNLAGTAREVVVHGTYAYIASTDNAQELQVVDISNPASPTLAATLNLATNNDALTVAYVDNHVYIGQGTSLRVVNVTNPASPTLAASLTLSGTVYDVALDAADSNQFLFAATSNSATEFRVVAISNPASPSIAATINITGNSPLRGVSYSQTLDVVAAVSNSNSQELILITPN